jgi:hypothetical protein
LSLVCEMTSWANQEGQDDKYISKDQRVLAPKAKRMNSRKVYIDEIQLLTCGIAKSCVCERERERERERFVAYYDHTRLEGLIYIVMHKR